MSSISSSEIKEDGNDEEFQENIYNTQENVMNNKNKTYYYSLMNISKYKEYTIYKTKENYLKEEKTENITKRKKYYSINKKFINDGYFDKENISKTHKIEKYSTNTEIRKENSEINKNNFENQLPSEEIFLRQKEKIKKLKEKNNQYRCNNSVINFNRTITGNNDNISKVMNKNNSFNLLDEINSTLNDNNISNQKLQSIVKQRKSFKEECNFLSLDLPQFFEISHLTIIEKINNNEDKEENEENFNNSEILPIISNNWEKIKKFKKTKNTIEFKDMAIRTINEVNYNNNGVEINLELSLVGGSEFWIFTRSFVNKDINDSEVFDTYSINNESDIIFNKYTSLIKIIKEKNSSKCFITFGTFYEDEKDGNKIKYETFLKRQLVDFLQLDSLSVNSNTVYYYLENDLLDIKAIIMDLGNEIIDAKIYINENKKFNHIEAKFYLPMIKRSKLLFCGKGQSAQVKKLRINSIEKFGEYENDEYQKKSCTCCNIF